MADTEAERRQGLSGRRQLAEDEGLLFIFNRPGRHSFWMKGMNFPLDFIWIAGDRIAGITPAVPVTAMNLMPSQPIDKVLEVNAGFAARYNLKIGDKVSYEPVSD